MKRLGAPVTWTFVVLHALALVLGLFGLLIAIPHPQLFANNPQALAFYSEALNNTGGTGMILGTIAMAHSLYVSLIDRQHTKQISRQWILGRPEWKAARLFLD